MGEENQIVKLEDRQDHGQQNETKDNYRTHNLTLEIIAGVTWTLQKPECVHMLRKGKQLQLFSGTRRVTQ